jgi:hypothetical protein
MVAPTLGSSRIGAPPSVLIITIGRLLSVKLCAFDSQTKRINRIIIGKIRFIRSNHSAAKSNILKWESSGTSFFSNIPFPVPPKREALHRAPSTVGEG